jgi:hypothetical protein
MNPKPQGLTPFPVSGPAGPQGTGFVVGSIVLLPDGVTPPPNYVYLGSYTEKVKDNRSTPPRGHDSDEDRDDNRTKKIRIHIYQIR